MSILLPVCRDNVWDLSMCVCLFILTFIYYIYCTLHWIECNVLRCNKSLSQPVFLFSWRYSMINPVLTFMWLSPWPRLLRWPLGWDVRQHSLGPLHHPWAVLVRSHHLTSLPHVLSLRGDEEQSQSQGRSVCVALSNAYELSPKKKTI